MTATTVRPTQSRDALLRNAIRLDGVVVAALGVAMVVAAGTSSVFATMPPAVEYGVGVLNIAYGPLAFWLASRRRVRTIGLVIAEINLATTVGLVALVAAGLAPTITLAVAAYTLAIGVVQYLGVRRLRA